MANKPTESVWEIHKDMIRNQMDEDEFWGWVRDWKDPVSLEEDAENWSEGEKVEDIENFIKSRGGCNATDWTKRACRTLDTLNKRKGG